MYYSTVLFFAGEKGNWHCFQNYLICTTFLEFFAFSCGLQINVYVVIAGDVVIQL